MQFPIYFISPTFFVDIEDSGEIVAYSKNTGHKYIIDPYTVEGDSLGVRRLRYSPKDKEPSLLSLRIAYSDEVDFKLGGRSGMYIDSTGRMEYWKGTCFARLLSYKIRNMVLNPDEGVYLISLIGYDKVIATKYPPPKEYKYIILLDLTEGAILAGYSTTPIKGGRRV